MSPPSKTCEAARLEVADLVQLARVDFGVFVVVLFPGVHNGQQLVPAPYVELMVEILMCVSACNFDPLIGGIGVQN
jgi:hypothetical protein